MIATIQALLWKPFSKNLGRRITPRYKRSTYCIQDCILLSVCVLISTSLSFSVISSNLLDVFYYFSHESESVASAYVFSCIFPVLQSQILEDLQFAFVVVGGLLADCVYGRVPLMHWSFVLYACSVSSFLLVLSFCSPSFIIVFAISQVSCLPLSLQNYGQLPLRHCSIVLRHLVHEL